MRTHDTPAPPTLAPSKDGVLFVSGHATALRVHLGHLVVRSGNGARATEARFPKVGRPKLRRVVIYGKGGFATWEALAWLDGIGASFLSVSTKGGIIAASGERAGDQPALRRAQALAMDSDAGLEIVRSLLMGKLKGQLANLVASFGDAQRSIDVVAVTVDKMREVASVRDALSLEARAASAYWRAWASLPVTFARADTDRIPGHWLTFGERRSPLSTSPRLAGTPANAVLNFEYGLAEAECRLALLAVGLDPGLGWAHRDAAYRDSAALDVLETIRPSVDRYLLELVRTRTFSRREFVELPSGQVRLGRALAKSLTEATLVAWEHQAATAAVEVARQLASSARSPVRIAGRRARGTASGNARASLGRRTAPSSRNPRRTKAACRDCGLVLDSPDRMYCEECLPGFKTERTDRLVSAARQVLAEMRASPHDPAQTPEAKAKRIANYSKRRAAARAWEESHPGPHDREDFLSRILPALQLVTVPQMMRASGLTSSYCWRIRRGDRIPHPMYWDQLKTLTHGRSR